MNLISVVVDNIFDLGENDGFHEPVGKDRMITGNSIYTPEGEFENYSYKKIILKAHDGTKYGLLTICYKSDINNTSITYELPSYHFYKVEKVDIDNIKNNMINITDDIKIGDTFIISQPYKNIFFPISEKLIRIISFNAVCIENIDDNKEYFEYCFGDDENISNEFPFKCILPMLYCV